MRADGDVHERIRRVADFAPAYIESLRATWDTNVLLIDWWDALRFWFSHCFYQGRRDEVSAIFEARSLAAVERFLGSRDIAVLRGLSSADLVEGSPLERSLAQANVPKRYDRLMVLSSLVFAKRLADGNIVLHSLQRIRAGEMEDLFYDLQEMKSVGEKVTSFYLRDLDFLFDLEAYIPSNGYILLQPLDTWVRQISAEIGIIPTLDNSPGNRRLIVRACLQASVNPGHYNVGAWSVGKQRQARER